MSAHIVPLRSEPSLMDLPGRLRWLADEIERADDQDIVTMLVVQLDADEEITTACFGINPTRTEVVGLLTRAALRVDRSA